MQPYRIVDEYANDSPPIPTTVGDAEAVRPKTYVDISMDVGPGVVAMVVGAPLAQPVFEQVFNWAINRCSRCGRFNHTILKCYARTRSDGTRL